MNWDYLEKSWFGIPRRGGKLSARHLLPAHSSQNQARSSQHRAKSPIPRLPTKNHCHRLSSDLKQQHKGGTNLPRPRPLLPIMHPCCLSMDTIRSPTWHDLRRRFLPTHLKHGHATARQHDANHPHGIQRPACRAGMALDLGASWY
jgi:hypothetical protein